jgi:hypothetical protein
MYDLVGTLRIAQRVEHCAHPCQPNFRPLSARRGGARRVPLAPDMTLQQLVGVAIRSELGIGCEVHAQRNSAQTEFVSRIPRFVSLTL